MPFCLTQNNRPVSTTGYDQHSRLADDNPLDGPFAAFIQTPTSGNRHCVTSCYAIFLLLKLEGRRTALDASLSVLVGTKIGEPRSREIRLTCRRDAACGVQSECNNYDRIQEIHQDVSLKSQPNHRASRYKVVAPVGWARLFVPNIRPKYTCFVGQRFANA
jgi:hypothetical protein